MKNSYENTIALTALRALLYEVNVCPKPGLVDRLNNGSHVDMDSFLFIDSSIGLYSYFYSITLKGMTHERDISHLLPSLRGIGIEAEEKMLSITGGVNTHKGIIFSLGIICATLGYMHTNNISVSLESLFRRVALVAGSKAKELSQNGINTYGERSYKAYGITGIRGEAAEGYPSVVRVAYPKLIDYINKGYSLNDACVGALINLIAVVEDTNIIGRSSLDCLRKIQGEAKDFLAKPYGVDELLKFANFFDEKFIALNISPGGSADLLALTLFVYFLLN